MEAPSREVRITLDRPVARADVRVTLHIAAPGETWNLSAEARVEPDAGRVQREFGPALRRFAESDAAAELPMRLGKELAAIALPGPIRARFLHELSMALPAPIRLWMDIRDEELAELPWEFLYLDNPVPGSLMGLRPLGHLALHPSIHLVRDVCSHAPSAPVEPITAAPLRILVACANPASPAHPRLVHAEAEAARIRAAAGSAAAIEVLHSATHASLHQALRRVRPHIFHFIGHGVLLPSGAAIVLEGHRAGAEDLLYTSELADWLRDACTRLAVLSACDLGSPRRGAVADLAGAGVAAVVAMQLPLRDASAPLFSGSLYSALVTGCTVEESLREARTAVRGVGPDWGSPLLALAGPGGMLFSLPQARTAAASIHTNLPYRKNPFFVGREELIGRIHGALSLRPVSLFGASGLGKTMAASEYAHAHMEDYPGGVYWVQASTPQLIRESLAAIGQRFFGVPEEASSEAAARRTLDSLQELDRPALIVVDDLKDDRHLRLPSTGPCRILVTSQLSHLWEAGFENMKVPDLDEESALQLLQIHRPARTTVEQEAARQIAAKLGRLPHALSLVAHSVKRHGIGFAQYLERLPKSKDLNSVFDPIRLSWQAMPSGARALLQTAACFAPQAISQELLFHANGPGNRDRFEAVLELLELRSLLSRDADDRLAMHSLVRLFVREHTPEKRRLDLTSRVAAAVADALKTANDFADWHSVRGDVGHARELAEECQLNGLDAERALLLRELGVYAAEHGETAAALKRLNEALSISIEGFGENSIETASCRRRIAETLQRRGDPAGALREARLAYHVARRIISTDDRRLADFLNTLGWVLKKAGRHGRALPFYRTALALNERVHGSDHPETLVCLNNIGMLLLAVDTAETRVEALTYLRKTLEVADATLEPDHASLAAYHNNLGQALQRAGTPADWQEALDHHLSAAAISEAAHGEPHPDGAAALYYAAECCRALGRLNEAVFHSDAALPLYVEFCGENDPRTQRVRNQARQLRLEIEHAVA